MTPAHNRLFTLWDSGEENAPVVVKHNLNRWRRLNPDAELTVFTVADAVSFLRPDFPYIDDTPIQAFSDILRISLLSKYGGIWIDPTVFPVDRLADWLPERMDASGFFAFSRPERATPASSWFLAAELDNLICKKWHISVQQFWQYPHRYEVDGDTGRPVLEIRDSNVDRVRIGFSQTLPDLPYFWFHALFAKLIETDDVAASLWKQTPAFPSDFCHIVQNSNRTTTKKDKKWRRLLGFPNANRTKLHRIWRDALRKSPVQKLDWRESYDLDVLERMSNELIGYSQKEKRKTPPHP